MKLGIVLPSFMYSAVRRKLACEAFMSLSRCESLQEETTILLLVKHGTGHEYAVPIENLSKSFRIILRTDEGLEGTEQTLAFGTKWLLDTFAVDYITWMGDDSLFHPMWLWQLESLIKRHPNAVSWSVYRSAYQWFHKTLKTAGEDVLVRSICGHGLTFSRKEWEEWGMDWKKANDYPMTLDLVHFDERAGERWVTKKSFIEHTGKVGVHCTEDMPEHAVDFQTADVI
jgi:hypothetical protein